MANIFNMEIYGNKDKYGQYIRKVQDMIFKAK